MKMGRVGLVIIVVLCIWVNIGSLNALRYDIEDYNCRYYSRDFEEIVERYLPIDVIIVRGEKTLDSNNGHVWVKICGIEIEPIGLFPFPNSLTHPFNIKCFDNYSDYESRYERI